MGSTIVKTEEMKRILSMPDAYVIPNGVDMERFVPADKLRARQKLNLDPEKKIVLFISVRNVRRKTFPWHKGSRIIGRWFNRIITHI